MPISNPTLRATETALGIAIGGREVGLAVVTREHLLAFEVKDLHKLASREGKESRFRNAILAVLDRFQVSRVALVAPPPMDAHRALVRAEEAWLAAEAAGRSLPLATHAAADVRARCVPPGRASNRALGEALAGEYPELWRSAASAEAVPGRDRVATLRRRIRTPRERYWARAFLALGAARRDLDLALLRRIDS